MSQEQPEQTKTILVVDDHELVLTGTLEVLRGQYPEAQILTAQTGQSTLSQVARVQPDLVVLDLSLPETSGETAQTDTGIQILRTLMKNYPNLNLVVLSSYIKALVRIKSDIDEHQGGFTVVEKRLSIQDLLTRVEIALQGGCYTRDLNRLAAEVKPEWLELLSLAFEEGLEDKTIAERMQIAPRTVRHYWSKIRDVLGVYPKDGKNLRIQTKMRAREKGFID